MGKHTAADDARVHPLVAEALARRSGAADAAHGGDGPERSRSTGWPEPPPGGGGAVGWPEEIAPDRGAGPGEEADGSTERAVTPAVLQPRRGWRRLFGASPAA